MSDIEDSTLEEALEKFLAEPREIKDGGWAAVQSDDIRLLDEIIYKLIERKFERDCDGDLPVQFYTIDRTRYQGMLMLDIPYTHSADRETKLKAIEAYSMLTKHYSDRLDTEIRCFRFES